MFGIKELFKDMLERTVVPAVDGLVKGWKTPLEIDDTLWGLIKGRILSVVDSYDFSTAAGPHGLVLSMTLADVKPFGFIPNITGKDMKELFVRFVENFVFPEIDHFVKNWTTPFELDDVAWTYLKAKIQELLADLGVVESPTGALALTAGPCTAPADQVV